MVPIGYIHEEHCAACSGGQDPSSTGLYKKRAPCRYYQTGNCRRGSSCPFAHISVAAPVETLALSHPAYPADHMYTYYHPVGQTSAYHPLTSQAHPAFLWQPYLPSPFSFDPRYKLVHQAETHFDYPDDRSDPSSAESSYTGTSVDIQLRTEAGATWLEGTESVAVRDIASPPGDPRVNSPSGFYSYPFFHGTHADHVVGGDRATDQGQAVARPSPLSPTCQDDAKKKPLAYKTKPCKFYTTNGKCTSGEKCTFIHGPESKRNAEKSPALSAPPDAKLPPKPHNKYEDCRTRDFYPITWRVIGGGVMMGGQRQTCPAFAAGHCKHGDDCKFAHEVEFEKVGCIEFKGETAGKGEGFPRQLNKTTAWKHARSGSQRRKSIKVPFPEMHPSVKSPSAMPHTQRPNIPASKEIEATGKNGDQVVAPSARDTPIPPAHRRSHSMSMVLKPPPPTDALHANYAAEL